MLISIIPAEIVKDVCVEEVEEWERNPTLKERKGSRVRGLIWLAQEYHLGKLVPAQQRDLHSVCVNLRVSPSQTPSLNLRSPAHNSSSLEQTGRLNPDWRREMLGTHSKFLREIFIE